MSEGKSGSRGPQRIPTCIPIAQTRQEPGKGKGLSSSTAPMEGGDPWRLIPDLIWSHCHMAAEVGLTSLPRPRRGRKRSRIGWTLQYLMHPGPWWSYKYLYMIARINGSFPHSNIEEELLVATCSFSCTRAASANTCPLSEYCMCLSYSIIYGSENDCEIFASLYKSKCYLSKNKIFSVLYYPLFPVMWTTLVILSSKHQKRICFIHYWLELYSNASSKLNECS